MHDNRRGASQSGFTLIETLLAMALFLLVIGTLATVTAQWVPDWNRGFARVQRTEQLGLGLERIVADVAAAEFISPNATVKRPIFEGMELSAIFVRTAIGPNTQPGLEIVRLAEIARDRGPVLVRTTAPFAPLEPDAGAILGLRFSEPIVVVRPPFRVSFAYSGPDRVWQPTWQGADRLPSAVQVTVRDAVTGQTLAVSSAAKVHVDAPAECASPDVRNCTGASAQKNDAATPDATRER
jgi:general secretion pathway protein J